MSLTVYKSEPGLVVSGNPVNWSIKTDSTTGSFYRIHIQVLRRLENLSLEVVGEDAVEPDSLGVAEFDISVWLQKLLKDVFFVFYFEGLAMSTELSKMYFLYYFYSYFTGTEINKSEPQMVLTSNGLHVLKAKLEDIQYKIYKKKNTNFYSDFFERGCFLTNQPRKKEIDRNQPERLYFIFLNLWFEYFFVKIKLVFTNGREETIKSNAITGNLFNTYSIKAGYNDLNLSEYESSENVLLQYVIYLESLTGKILSEEFTFILSRVYNEHVRYFIFKNRLGGYDTVRLTGIKEIENKYEAITGQNSFGKFKLDSIKEEIHKANTGLISAEYNKYLQEIFDSTEVYEYEDDLLYNVIITNSESSVYKDNQFLFDQTFEYYRDLNLEMNFTGSGSGSIQNGIAEFVYTNPTVEVIDGEIVAGIDVTNVSIFDGETYVVFDFGVDLDNGDDFEEAGITYFYYSDSSSSNKYAKKKVKSDDNQVIAGDKVERAIFVHYYIEYNYNDIDYYEAGRLVIINDGVNAQVIPERTGAKGDCFLIEHVDFTASVIDNQIEVQIIADDTITNELNFYYYLV